jgi:hypothetical protein
LAFAIFVFPNMVDCTPHDTKPPSEIHYWEDLGSKWELSTVLSSDETDNPRHTLRAWDDVAKHSFPRNDMFNSFPTRDNINGQEIHWAVHHEPFQTPEGKIEYDKPQAIVVRAGQWRQHAQSPQQRSFQRYNWLMIETAPPSLDTPEGWKDLLTQACYRMSRYNNGAHDICIICAIGLKYMALRWDPKNADNATQELRIRVAGSEVHFPSQLMPVPDLSPHLPNLKADRTSDQYAIDIGRVWSADPGQVDARGQAMRPLVALEAFFNHIRTTPLQNPALY